MPRRIDDRNIWVINGAVLLLGIAYGVSIAVLAIHLSAHGIPKLAMGALSASFAVGIAGLSIPAGWLIARAGAKKTMLGALLGYAVCVSAFPFLTTVAGLSLVRFFDGAFSVGIWVAAETALLSRSSPSNKAYVMSLYAIALAIGYVVGPLLARAVVSVFPTSAAFIAAAILACAAAAVIFALLDERAPRASEASGEPPAPATESSRAASVFWRIKTSCLATFSYGYFQASVVLFLPLYLVESKGIEEKQTIYITAFFALGMLSAATWMGRLGDRYGHLLVMRVLGALGGTMVASFVLLPSFASMCAAVFVAGATLASISPVSLALQGVVTPSADLGRANGFYNASYAVGMLIGPPLSGVLFTRIGGVAMLLHLAALWAFFVFFTALFASDDPRRARRMRGAPRGPETTGPWRPAPPRSIHAPPGHPRSSGSRPEPP
ncbi:MFS transporter [Pendulispora albinea]|uniref:MFS transporter n=1 Tax=Pendulispora albinea TaxID=2741071 RepID=A0ABZ2M1V9_9BACT